jgi:hypothetical protein
MDPISNILNLLSTPFWKHWDFWLSFTVSILGLIASLFACREAYRAKIAANKAGKTVKIHTIGIDLSEINQKILKTDPNISYIDAKEFLQEISNKIIRSISSIDGDSDYSEYITNIKKTLDTLSVQLRDSRPIDPSTSPKISEIYYATEHSYIKLSRQIAELLGKFDKRTIDNS